MATWTDVHKQISAAVRRYTVFALPEFAQVTVRVRIHRGQAQLVQFVLEDSTQIHADELAELVRPK